MVSLRHFRRVYVFGYNKIIDIYIPLMLCTKPRIVLFRVKYHTRRNFCIAGSKFVGRKYTVKYSFTVLIFHYSQCPFMIAYKSIVNNF